LISLRKSSKCIICSRNYYLRDSLSIWKRYYRFNKNLWQGL